MKSKRHGKIRLYKLKTGLFGSVKSGFWLFYKPKTDFSDPVFSDLKIWLLSIQQTSLPVLKLAFAKTKTCFFLTPGLVCFSPKRV